MHARCGWRSNRLIRTAVLAVALAAVCVPCVHAADHDERGGRRPVKVLIVTAFGQEAQVWLERLGPWREFAVPGLSQSYPVVHCNRSDVCVITTGMGHSNAAASMTALVFSRMFDLSRAYFIVTGVGGIVAAVGATGLVASFWIPPLRRYVVARA